MVRNVAIGVGIAVAAFVAYQFLHVTELDVVEEEMERLFDVARNGGEDAVDEILDAFADDYRGAGPFRIDSIRRNLRYALVPAGSATGLKRGDFQPVARSGEILVPIVSVSGEVKGNPVRVVVSVLWGRREGRWKIVDITRWRMGE